MIDVMVRKHARLKRFAAVLGIVVLVGGYTAYALLRPLSPLVPNTPFHFSRAATPVSISWPSYGEAAIGAVGYGTLETHGDQAALPTASVIKLLTALAVLQKYPLQVGESGPTITLTQADVDSYNKYVAEDGSVAKVAVGEQITEYEALQALLLPSANNMAETLARWAFGSIDAYIAYATAYVQQLGMTHTTVTDPSGFLPTTTSTPTDLLALGQAALQNPVLAAITDQASATIPVQGTIYNVNQLLGQEGIIGLKTGNNDQDTGCFLFAAQQTIDGSPLTFVGVIMNGPNLYRAMHDSLPLIRSMEAGFVSVPVATTTTAIARYTPASGEAVAAVPAQTASALVWSNSTTTASVAAQTLKSAANQSQGKTVGSLTISNSLTGTTTIPVVLQHPIAPPSIWWRLTHPF